MNIINLVTCLGIVTVIILLSLSLSKIKKNKKHTSSFSKNELESAGGCTEQIINNIKQLQSYDLPVDSQDAENLMTWIAMHPGWKAPTPIKGYEKGMGGAGADGACWQLCTDPTQAMWYECGKTPPGGCINPAQPYGCVVPKNSN